MTGTDLIAKPQGPAPIILAEPASPEAFAEWRGKHRMRRDKALPSLAAREGRADIIRLLFDTNYNGKSTLYCGWLLNNLCYADKNAPLVRTLLEGGVDPDRKYNIKYAPLAVATAANYGAENILALLLKSGASTELVFDIDGDWTPLMYAAYRRNSTCVQLLLDAGARTSKKNKKNETAKNIAYARNAVETGNLIHTHEKRIAEEKQKRSEEALLLPPPPPPVSHCPPGWSIVDKNGAEMAIQAIEDPASKMQIRNTFDFKGKRLMTVFNIGGQLTVSDKRFEEVEADLITEARGIFDSAVATKKAGEASSPGLI